MKVFKRSCRICLFSFKQWLGSFRIMIVFLGIFTQCHMVMSPVRNFLEATGTKINVAAPMFFYEYYINRFLVFLMFIILLCDAPFINKTQQMVILRSGRMSWGIGKILYIAASAVIYVFTVYLFNLILLFPYIEFSNKWGEAVMTLSKTDAAAQFNIIGIFFGEKIVDFFTPGQALFFSMLLCVICAVVLGLIIFVGNFVIPSVKLGILIAVGFVLWDFIISITVKRYRPITYLSPASWTSLTVIDIGGMKNTPDIVFVESAYAVLLSCLIIAALMCSMRKQIEQE